MSDFDHRSAGTKTGALPLDNGDEESTPPSDERVLSIENVARMFGVSRLTLRYYEIRGLIRRRHVMGRTRVYGWADCERLAFILKCRKAGLPLSEIRTIIAATDDNISVRAFLIGQEKCMALMDRLERRRKVFDDALAELSHIHTLLTTKLGEPRETPHRD